MICARSSRLPALIYAFLERFHCAEEGLSFAESGSRASCSNLHLARTARANKKPLHVTASLPARVIKKSFALDADMAIEF